MTKWLLLMALCWSLPGQATDLLREQRIAETIERDLQFGSAQRLQADGREFLAVHEEADSDAIKGGILLLHGSQGHADSLGVIHGLRTGLVRHGWETLALQLPLASAGAPQREQDDLVEAALPRIQAGVDFYAKRNLKQLVLIGHGSGARQAVRFLAKQPQPQVKGLILIGLALHEDQTEDLEALKKIQVPLLDLAGAEDVAAMDSARLRRKTVRYGGNKNYRQDSIIGAGHDFLGREQMLRYRLVGWLNRHAPNDKPGTYQAIGN